MGQLTLDSIQISGFGSFVEHDPPVYIGFGGRGAVAVTGPNGVGKSTLASKALAWALYGKTSPERMGSGTRVLRAKGVVNDESKVALVRVVFKGDRGSWIIERKRKRSGSDDLTVTRPDGTTANDQAAVDNLIGVGHSIFCQTVLRGQNDPWNFAEATDSKKRQILDVLSGAAALREPHEKAKKAAGDLKASIGTLEARVRDARERIDRMDVGPLRAKAEAWDASRADRIQEAEGEVKALESAYTSIYNSAQNRSDLGDRPTLDMQPYRDAIERAREEWQKHAAHQQRMQAQFDAVVNLSPGSDCPTCGQTIAPDAPVARQRDRLTQPCADADQAEYHARRALDEAKEAMTGAEAWLQEAQEAHDARAAALPSGDRVQAAWDALEAARARLDMIRNEANPWHAAASEAERNAQAEEQQLAVLEEMIRINSDEYDIARVWADALHPKGAPADLAEAAIVAIQNEANRWLTALSAGTMQIEFTTRSKTGKADIRVKLKVREHGKWTRRDLQNFSGGEKARINFAVDLGVAAVFSRGADLSLSLLVIDEGVFAGLDAKGKQAVLHAIMNVGVRDIVLVDHDPRLHGAVSREIRVRKEDKHGTIVEEIEV